MDEGPCTHSLSDWVERYYGLLYRYAYRLSGSTADAEDLTQQAFLIAQAKQDQLREPEHAKAWLCAILRNAYLKSLQKANGVRVVSLDVVREPSSVPPADAPVDPEELQSVLNEMPEEFRTPLILFYFEEFSYKEIAGQMEVPIGTVMSRLARGKQFLRSRLAAPQTVGSHP
jgi:RNA polymerase sigma-70 factor (ECF subfamily)